MTVTSSVVAAAAAAASASAQPQSTTSNNNAALSPPPTAKIPSPTLPDAVSPSPREEEDEPYTIKCICTFEDDDGSTVYCERCDTWQHIVCYYEDREVPEIHNCVDCEPRFLDARGATERQRRLREQNVGGDRKSKRTANRSSKKRTKDRDNEQANPSLPTRERSASVGQAKDSVLPPSKRSKTSHRPSSSVTSLNGYSFADRKRSSAHIPQIPYYSSDFLHLYDDDQGNVDKEANLFLTIALTKDLMSWAQDPLTIPQDGNGRSARYSFMHLDHPLDSSLWPGLSTRTKVDDSIEIEGRHPTWKFLTVNSDVRRDEIVGEVRGKVGYLRDYSLDPTSRWKELRHPEPFVFFHPLLPIYIDSREEGTQLRYVRRSCQPNVTLRTFITNQSEYHFCFVANQDIPADAEITATWYLDPQLFGANGLLKDEGSNEIISDAASITLSNVLSHFGGCACESPACFLAKIDRRRPPQSLEAASKQSSSKRSRTKARTQHRPSEGSVRTTSISEKQQAQRDDDDASDAKSIADSARAQSQSRDRTPNDGTSMRSTPLFGELSAREKRKLAAVEKKFEQLEQDQQQQPAKRSKRKDRASTVESARRRSSSPAKSSKTAPATNKPAKIDVAGSRRTSSSSTKASPKSAVPNSRRSKAGKHEGAGHRRPVYVDVSVQTDPDPEDPDTLYAPPPPPPPSEETRPPVSAIPFVPHHVKHLQSLLKTLKADRERFEAMQKKEQEQEKEREKEREEKRKSPAADVSANLDVKTPPAEDVEMKDADADGDADADAGADAPATAPENPPGSPLPSMAAHMLPARSASETKPEPETETAIEPVAPSPGPAPAPVAVPRESQSRPEPTIVTPAASAETQPQSPVDGRPSSSANAQHTPAAVSPPPPSQNAAAATPAATSTTTTATTTAAPVKKKLTLGDYMSRRGTMSAIPTPISEKTQAQAMGSSSTAAAAPPGTQTDGKAQAETGKPAAGSPSIDTAAKETVVPPGLPTPVSEDVKAVNREVNVQQAALPPKPSSASS